MRRQRNAKIVATLGPASSTPETVRELFFAGADVFRLNFSHGEADEHRRRIEIIRELERETNRPIGVILDLQGPKLRLGTFREQAVVLEGGQHYRLDLDPTPGDQSRANLPHPEVFAALREGALLQLDDGRVRLQVERCGPDYAETTVRTGGEISARKGVNIPDVVLDISPFTDKDRRDLEFGLELGVDWVAPSFIQRPRDLRTLRDLIAGEATIITKLEKPAAMERLADIVALSDGVMVARGDLGVEMPPEQVPIMQKRIVRACREAGKPVVVATQMLESMIRAPVPTRAEASDVATAVYDGADAVMLSGETAVGKYPRAAVQMMDLIIQRVEEDPYYRQHLGAELPAPRPTTADAICDAMGRVAHTLPVQAMITFTSSGFTSLRAARERPEGPILSVTPNLATARMLTLVWGVHSVQSRDIREVSDMVSDACRLALREEFAHPGDTLVITAGMPFGVSGTTNLLHIAHIPD